MSDPQRNATTASSMESRTCCPSPVRSRASNAAVIACAATTPVSLSGTIVRTRRGRAWSEPPWMLASPDSAWISGSYTGFCANGPCFAEAADRDVDDVRAQRADRSLAKAHPVDHPGAKVLDEHVGGGDQPLQRLDPGRRLQVQHDRPLVAVVVEERGRKPAPPVGRGPRMIATLRVLDLDDIRALVSQQHGG